MSTAQELQGAQECWSIALLSVGMCIFWLTNYIGMIYKSFEDRTYSMPLMSLCSNLACEFVYGVIHPLDVSSYSYAFAIWFFLDCLVAIATLKFAPNEWKDAPLVRDNLNLIFAVSVAGWMTVHLALVAQFGTLDAVAWGSWFTQIFLSAGCLCQLIVRGSSRGTSFFLW